MSTPRLFLDPHAREEGLLAPYALRARDTRGREVPEEESAQRSAFQRDRDRIVHCTAFRRLEYKTQVFVNHEGDHYRTRLTHTLEVAQIARAAARGLGLNEDLVEAIALSHDLGHPPFGHAGEEQLDTRMAACGGFNHNRQSYRVVTELEQRYPDFPGLNLSWEVREAIAKHGYEPQHADSTAPGAASQRAMAQHYDPATRPSLEAQLVDFCDSLAYSNHDIDDGLRSGTLTLEQLREMGLWSLAEDRIRDRWPTIRGRDLVARTVSHLIDTQVVDLLTATFERIEAHGIESADDARRCDETLVGFSPKITELTKEMRTFLHAHVYQHPHTLKMARKGKRFIAAIFDEYVAEPGQLPREFAERLDEHPLERVVCDYIAGMTDRFCNQEYERLFMPFGPRHA